MSSLRGIAGSAAGLVLGACMAMVPDDTYANGYSDVHDAPSFWVREWEVAGDQQGVSFRGAPTAFKDCVGREAMQLSPPNLAAAVDRFVASKTAGNYKALIPMVRKFTEGYEQTYGIKPGARAGELCKEHL